MTISSRIILENLNKSPKTQFNENGLIRPGVYQQAVAETLAPVGPTPESIFGKLERAPTPPIEELEKQRLILPRFNRH